MTNNVLQTNSPVPMTILFMVGIYDILTCEFKRQHTLICRGVISIKKIYIKGAEASLFFFSCKSYGFGYLKFRYTITIQRLHI